MKTLVRSHRRRGKHVRKHIRKSRAKWHDVAYLEFHGKHGTKKLNAQTKHNTMIDHEIQDRINNNLTSDSRWQLNRIASDRKEIYNEFKDNTMKPSISVFHKPKTIQYFKGE